MTHHHGVCTVPYRQISVLRALPSAGCIPHVCVSASAREPPHPQVRACEDECACELTHLRASRGVNREINESLAEGSMVTLSGGGK